MEAVIYKITNTVNQKIYIGSTSNFEKRKREHFDPKNGPRMIITLAIIKYGEENFKFEFLESYNIDSLTDEEVKDLILPREQFYLDTLQPFASTGTGYNICEIAGSTLGRKGYSTSLKGKSHTGKNIKGIGNKANKSIELISPTGEIKFFESRTLASEELNLNLQALSHLVTGRSLSTSGWKLVNGRDRKPVWNKGITGYKSKPQTGLCEKGKSRPWSNNAKGADHPGSKTFTLYNKNTKETVSFTGVRAFCREYNLASASNVSALLNGKLKSYKGWTKQ